MCEVTNFGEPENWMLPEFDYSSWDSATVSSEEEAGWGIPPKYGLPNCGKATSPFTRLEMGPIEGCTPNYANYVPTLDSPWVFEEDHEPVCVVLTEEECLIPADET
eukprot:UN00481